MKLRAMIYRNTKLFFKDKGMVFASLITPIILLVLYATFLGNIYHSTFSNNLPEGFPEGAIKGAVAGQLLSSIMAVCCVTTAFSSNMLMVQDKVNGTRSDFTVAPVKSSVLSIGYYISTALTTLIISFLALAATLLYTSTQGWFISAADIGCLCLDVVLTTLFGTALSSIVCLFLSTQGQISAVGAIVSSGYGFLCGAYMPISQFSTGLQKVLSFLPGTYATSLFRNHAMRGAFAEMSAQGAPDEALEELRKAVDCRLMFFDNEVPQTNMYIFLACSVVVLMGIFVLLSFIRGKEKA